MELDLTPIKNMTVKNNVIKYNFGIRKPVLNCEDLLQKFPWQRLIGKWIYSYENVEGKDIFYKHIFIDNRIIQIIYSGIDFLGDGVYILGNTFPVLRVCTAYAAGGYVRLYAGMDGFAMGSDRDALCQQRRCGGELSDFRCQPSDVRCQPSGFRKKHRRHDRCRRYMVGRRDQPCCRVRFAVADSSIIHRQKPIKPF